MPADAPPTPALTRAIRAVPLVLAALVGILVADGEFVFDDTSALHDNPVVHGGVAIWEAFTRDFWGRTVGEGYTTWRPAMPLVWRTIWAWWPNPLPFRILSAALHVATVWLAMRFCGRLRSSTAWAVSVGVLFALHPLNTEAVSAIVAQADLASFAVVLVACTVALRPPSLRVGLLCSGWFLLASLIKESAIIFTPLAAASFMLSSSNREHRAAAITPLVVVSLVVAVFQLTIPRAPGIAMVTSNLAYHATGSMRLLLGFHNIGRSLALAGWPEPLVPNHGYATVELYWESLAPFALLGAAGLVVGVALGAWALRTRRLDWVAALAFLYAPALLQSHWFARLITDVAERLLYPSALGVSMLVSMGLLRLLSAPLARAVAVAACGAVFVAGSFSARRAWTDTDALWTYSVEAEPRSALHHHNVSNTYFRADDVSRGAYHRLLYTYLIERFPDPVAWDAITANAALPVDERVADFPDAVSPGDPCPLIRVFLRSATRHPPLHDYVVAKWSGRYPACSSWTTN